MRLYKTYREGEKRTRGLALSHSNVDSLGKEDEPAKELEKVQLVTWEETKSLASWKTSGESVCWEGSAFGTCWWRKECGAQGWPLDVTHGMSSAILIRAVRVDRWRKSLTAVGLAKNEGRRTGVDECDRWRWVLLQRRARERDRN